MRSHNLKNSIIAWTILLIILIPFFTGWITSQSNPFIIFGIDNNWISFFGSYFGGMITLVGVAITLLYAHNDSKNEKRLQIRPYLRYRELTKLYMIDQTKDLDIFNDYKLGFHYYSNEETADERDIEILKMEIHGEVENIGLNSLCNLGFKNFKIENKSYNISVEGREALKVGEKTYMQIAISGFVIESDYFTNEFYNSKINHLNGNEIKIPEYCVSFDFYYDDLMGNHYSQSVTMNVQDVLKKLPDDTEAHYASFVGISSPKVC